MSAAISNPTHFPLRRRRPPALGQHRHLRQSAVGPAAVRLIGRPVSAPRARRFLECAPAKSAHARPRTAGGCSPWPACRTHARIMPYTVKQASWAALVFRRAAAPPATLGQGAGESIAEQESQQHPRGIRP